MSFMSISEYNGKFGTNITENLQLEDAIKKARREMGPNDFLVQSFGLKRRPAVAPTSKAKASVESKSIDDLLEEDLEDEYEEACKDCKKKHDGRCFKDQVDAMPIQDAQTLNHLIAFEDLSADVNMEERTMKGKSRYLDQLKAYMNGDESAEIRMFNGRKMLVSALNPNKDSLKQMFESFPSGPHIISCD